MSQGNFLAGSATFEHDGQEYRITLDNGVWIEAEDVLGYSILDAVEELRVALETGRNPRLKTMCAIVYGGLKQNHPDVTEQFVVNLFFSGNPEFKEAVLKAMQGAQLPDLPDDAGDEGNAAGPKAAGKAGTGKPSTSRGAKAGSTPKGSGRKRRAA